LKFLFARREGEKLRRQECFIPYKKCTFPHHIPHSVDGKRGREGAEETIKLNKICMATEKKTIWPNTTNAIENKFPRDFL
jgi:hypothetical protein